MANGPKHKPADAGSASKEDRHRSETSPTPELPISEDINLDGPNSRKCFRTLITIEVLSVDEPYQFTTYEDLAHDVIEGDFSGVVLEESPQQVDVKTFVGLCEKQGSDPDFFFCGEDPMGEDSGEDPE